MSKLNGQKVKQMSLKEGTFIPGIGSVGKDFYSSASNGNHATNMVIEVPFVLIELADKDSKRLIPVAIPLANCKHLVLETEVKPLPKPLK